MIYPSNYEQKIGFDEIRRMLKGHCQSTLGQEKVDEMAFSDDASVVNEWQEQVREMRRLMQAQEKPEMNYFFDVRESVARIRLENTHLEENELWDLRRSLETIGIIVTFLNRGERLEVRGESIDDAQEEYLYPALHRMAEDVQTFPAMIRRIDSILDKIRTHQGFGNDGAGGHPSRHGTDGGKYLAYLIYYFARGTKGRTGESGRGSNLA